VPGPHLPGGAIGRRHDKRCDLALLAVARSSLLPNSSSPFMPMKLCAPMVGETEVS